MNKKEREKPNQEEKQINEKLIFMMNEAIPTSQQDRKKYVGDVAFFYNTIFRKKLQHFIGLQLEELAVIGRTELGNNILRSNISCFRLIDDWCKEMLNEHLSNMNQVRQSFGEDKNIIKDLKDKYENKTNK